MSLKSKKWNPKVDQRRIELQEKGYSFRKAAIILTNEFGVEYTKNAVSSRARALSIKESEVATIVSSTPKGVVKTATIGKNDEKLASNEKLFSDELYSLDEETTFTPEKKRRLFEIWDEFNDGRAKKILSLSDLHSPFMDFAAIESALKSHADADILVLNGDVLDCNALSDFDKLNDFDIEIELKRVFAFLDVASKMFDTILWVGGNHDLGRFMRFVARKFGTGMKKYVMKRLNPIDYIAEKYSNVIVVPHDWIEIGRCIFVHPSGYSSALMSTAIGQENILRANAKDMLPEPNFHCLVQGHTHDLGSYFINDCLIIEQGCLTETMDYRFDRPTSRRWQKGYAVVYMDEKGNVDHNETRWYKS